MTVHPSNLLAFSAGSAIHEYAFLSMQASYFLVWQQPGSRVRVAQLLQYKSVSVASRFEQMVTWKVVFNKLVLSLWTSLVS